MNQIKARFLFAVSLAATVSFSSCSSNIYSDKAFFSRNQVSNQLLAVLPAEIQYRGNLPKDWTSDRISKMQHEESLAMQTELHDDFLFRTAESRKKYPVKLMDLKIVNDRLRQNGISIEQSWTLPSDELMKILNTNMLVRSRIDRQRHMSEAAATGINIGASVVEGLLKNGNNNTVFVPRAKSSDIDMGLTMYHSSRSEPVARMVSGKKLRVRKLPVYVNN